MLDNFLEIVSACEIKIENGTLFCNDWKVTNKEIIHYLLDNNCFEQNIYIDDFSVGDVISLELSISELCKIGFYDACENFLLKNKYEFSQDSFYILENKIYSKDINNIFICKIKKIHYFINSIKDIAKYTFVDFDVLNTVLSNEKQSIVITFQYSYTDIQDLNDEQFQKIDDIANTINGDNLEKHNLYVNELIDFLQNKQSNNNFKILLKNILELHENCYNAYQFYISNFSSNKLKFEINTKIVDYTTKIQNIINDVQTRLIAIPSAFVLSGLALDFNHWHLMLSLKNIITIVSLFIFCILIQLFLSNQKTILRIIDDDIKDFKTSLKAQDSMMEKFNYVDETLKEQKKRLLIITIILWLIPSLFVFLMIISVSPLSLLRNFISFIMKVI